MKKKPLGLAIGVALLALLVAGGLWALRLSKGRCGARSAASEHALAAGATNAAAANVQASDPSRKGTNAVAIAKRPGKDATQPESLTPDQKTAEEMNERLDNKDEKATIELARKIIKSDDAEVRSSVVSALGWIGVRALPELSQMLGDKDEGVARMALEQWQNAVEEVQDEDMRGKMLAAGMQALTDPEELETTVMDFNELPDAIAVRYLTEVIESSNAVAAQVARAQYEQTTGEEYKDRSTSEKWIKENTEPQ